MDNDRGKEQMHIDDLFRNYCTFRVAEFQGKVILVVGECGDGKTTLVNNLREISKEKPGDDDVKACVCCWPAAS